MMEKMEVLISVMTIAINVIQSKSDDRESDDREELP
jgi:hypothetical protein